MTHHNRRAGPRRPAREPNPFVAAIEAARAKIIAEMAAQHQPVYYLSPREYDEYKALIGPDRSIPPNIRRIEPEDE